MLGCRGAWGEAVGKASFPGRFPHWKLCLSPGSSPRWVPALPQPGSRHRVGHVRALGLRQEGTFMMLLHAPWMWCQGNVGPGAPTSPKRNVPPEGGEAAAHGGCNLLIPERCILQKGPRPHENSVLPVVSHERLLQPLVRHTQESEQATITENARLCCYGTGWKEQAGAITALCLGKRGACLLYFFFHFTLFLFGFCLCSGKPN